MQQHKRTGINGCRCVCVSATPILRYRSFFEVKVTKEGGSVRYLVIEGQTGSKPA